MSTQFLQRRLYRPTLAFATMVFAAASVLVVGFVFGVIPRLLTGPAGQAVTGRDAPAAKGTLASPSRANNETDPAQLARFDTRRARYVEARHAARQMIEAGRLTRQPLALLAAASLLQQTPPPRRLSSSTALSTEDSADPSDAHPRDGLPESADLLAEARAMLQKPAGLGRSSAPGAAFALGVGPQQTALLLLDKIEQSEVVVRGAAMGPQQTCDQISSRMKLDFQIIYEGNEKAVLALSGVGPGQLQISISDQGGTLLSKTQDRTLVSWNPKRREVFRVEIENSTADSISFCMETN